MIVRIAAWRFGNLYQLVRNGQNSLNVTVDGTTNRISSTGYRYDANGNLTSAPGATYTYDVSNRVVSNGAVYDASNQRVWDGQKMYFYGPGGELMGTYDVAADEMKHRYYFAGKLIKDGDDWVVTDRKGAVAVQGNTRVKHAPYGNGGSGAQHSEWKEDGDGLQYANQRYYSVGMGRFLTADPYRASGGPGNPGSWNRYAYVLGDPVNYYDRRGLIACPAGYSSRGQDDYQYCWPDDVPDGLQPAPDAPMPAFNPFEEKPAEDLSFDPDPAADTQCAVPAGAVFSLNGSLGVLGGQSTSASVYLDFDNGHAYVALTVGLQVGWNGGLAAGASAGYIFGPVNATQNIMNGGNTGAQVSVGPIQINGAAGSGGPPNLDPTLISISQGIAVTLGVQASLVPSFLGGGAYATSTIRTYDLGSFTNPGLLNTLFFGNAPGLASIGMYAVRQLCH